ncbi:hypothetical protein ACFV1N_44235 [Streptosporangium canum]|uniref:hypothetical protein n=1 Tax=Streptosporangium canum TaxID=324952 RepID=UPI00368CFB30
MDVLGDIVAVLAVRETCDRGAPKAEPMFSRISATLPRCGCAPWAGSRPAFGEPRLHLLGYGDWTRVAEVMRKWVL